MTVVPSGVVSVAGCHVLPASVETSTPATTPPPLSVALPVIVVLAPSCRFAPAVGEMIVELGAVVSEDGVAATSPLDNVFGWAPMSASRLTVACCIFGSGALPLGSVLPSPHALVLSSPHAHCTVPAPNTSAPLGARSSVRWCVAVWLLATLVP